MPTIFVKVKPGSKSTSVQKTEDMFGKEIYEVRLTSLPKDGKANEELFELLADYLDIPKTSFEIKSGATSRDKVINF